MASLTANVLVYQQATKGGSTTYSGTFDVGEKGWLTGLVNKTLGPIYFPLFGKANATISNPDTVLQLDSMQALTPTDIQNIYGNAAPPLPVDIVFLMLAVGFDAKDNNDVDNQNDKPGISSEGNAGDEPPSAFEGPTLPVLELEVLYDLEVPIGFNVNVATAEVQGKLLHNRCGDAYRSLGDLISLTASIDEVSTAKITDVAYKWVITGADRVKGADTDPTITLKLDKVGQVKVRLVVSVTADFGSGIQVEVETTVGSKSFSFIVRGPVEAEASEILCRIKQETLPISHFFSPGDPRRPSLSSARARTERLLAEVRRLGALLEKLSEGAI